MSKLDEVTFSILWWLCCFECGAAQVDLKRLQRSLDEASVAHLLILAVGEQTVRNNMVKAICIVERGEVRGQVTLSKKKTRMSRSATASLA